MGPYRGGKFSRKDSILIQRPLTVNAGQAQYIRVPYADFNALKLPPGKEHEADFVLLAGEFDNLTFVSSRFPILTHVLLDIFPTGTINPFIPTIEAHL